MVMVSENAGNMQSYLNRNWVKHYAWIGLWWISLGYVVKNNSAMAGLAFLGIFFLLSTWRKLGKTVFLAIVVGLLCTLFPFLEPVAFAVGLICVLMKFHFLIRNWRPLLVGLYTYGVYGFVLILTKTVGLITYVFSGRMAEAFASSGQIDGSYPLIFQALPFVFTGVLAFFLHKMVRWLYQHNYDTDSAFGIMGITPLLVVGFVLPFIKFMDADYSFDFDKDGIDDLTSSADSDADADGLTSRDVIDAGKNLANNYMDDIPDGVPDEIDSFITELQGSQDMDTAFWSSIQDIPPQVHAAMAAAAAMAVMHADKKERVFHISGVGKVKVHSIDDTHAELLGAGDCQLGTIFFDKRNACERINLSNGNMYIINYRTGKIRDGKGHILGWVNKGSRGNIELTNRDHKPIGVYESDGRFIGSDNRMTGVLDTK